MATRISRWTQKIFASSAANNGVFGSGADGTKVLSNDLSVLQSKAAWLTGWLSATLGASKFPPLEEMQSLNFVNTTQIAYMFQEGVPAYDAATIYFTNSIVKLAGTFQLYGSLTDNNTGVTPGTDGAVWQLLVDLAVNNTGFSTGDYKLTLKTTADSGFVLCDDGTIGNAASGATTRANADTVALFTLLWTNVTNTFAPVSGGRGANAAADFAANKTIGLTKVLGRALAISGTGSGLSARTLGQTVGEETHILTVTEMPSHNHTITDPTHQHITVGSFIGTYGNAGTRGAGSYAGAITGPTDFTSLVGTGITINNTGGDGAHNNMQPTSFMNIMIKL